MRVSRFWTVVSISFAAALILRIALAAQFVGLDSALRAPKLDAQPDQIEYEFLALQMSRGHGYTQSNGSPAVFRPPGTSFFLWPVYQVFGRNYAAGRIWFCFLSALTCIVVGWVGAMTFGRPVGALAAAFLALYPNHAYYSLHFVSEIPFGLLVTLAVGFSVKALREQTSMLAPAVAGFFWGAACLVRPNILLALPLIALAPWALSRGARRWQLRPLVVLGLVTAAVIGPWMVRNRLVAGQWTIATVGAWTFLGAHNELMLQEKPGGWVVYRDPRHPPTGNDAVNAATCWRESFEFLSRHWRSIPYLILMKIYRLLTPFEDTPNRIVYWTFAISWIVVAPWAGLGIYRALRQGKIEAVLLLCPLLAIVATAVVFYGSARFRDSVAPLYMIFAAFGVLSLINTRPVVVRKPSHAIP